MDASRRREVELIRQILVRGIAAAKAGEEFEARYYLQMVIDQRSEPDQQIDAFYYLSLIEPDPDKKRALIGSILAIRPSEPRARRTLAVLDGALASTDSFNPDTDKITHPETKYEHSVLRFECPSCGGHLGFDPALSSLACPNCGYLYQAAGIAASPEEQNFTAGLNSAKGHFRLRTTPVFTCKACGVEYVLSPFQLSFQCPQCDSSYSVVNTETKDLIPPGAVYPPALSAKDADRKIRDWLQQHHLAIAGGPERQSPLFLPFWTFDFGGTANWSAEVYKNQEWGPLRGTKLVKFDDLLVPASIPSRKIPQIETEDLSRSPLAKYSSELTAGWFAQTYSITLSDAAISARGMVVKQVRRSLENEILGEFRQLRLITTDITIDAYKLVLVPVWVSHYSVLGKRYEVAVNAATGEVAGGLPPTRLDRFIQWLLGH